MKRARMQRLLATAVCCQAAMLMAAPPPGTRLNFVSCPIVRDTPTVPCWVSDYDGERYYLTIQSDVSAEVQPPMLGHQVLVEGVVADAPSICGGVVLSPVRLSVMPERDANCNQMLPVDERYTIDFNPRPPGPSGGRLAFDPAPGAARSATPPPSGAQRIDLYFDFDRGVSFRHPGDLVTVIQRARQIGATTIKVTGTRGAHLLSDGTLLRESAGIARRRAEEVAGLLQGAGVDLAIDVAADDSPAAADGVEDWRSRRVTVEMAP